MHPPPQLHTLRAFFRERKRMPHTRELMAITGFRSTQAAAILVEHLLDHAFLDTDATGRLLPGRFFAGLAVLGTVCAGFPSPAEEELGDTMSLDEYLITNKEATYLLKVTGDSMIEAGILPGDLLLVERGAAPRDGAILIAQVDRDWTMKNFQKRGRRGFLGAGKKDLQQDPP